MRCVVHGRWSTAIFLALAAAGSAVAQEPQRLLIEPYATDVRYAQCEAPHLIVYRRDVPAAPLLVWLAGTGGKPVSGPSLFFDAAVGQGYRLLALSYLTRPAVSQVCVGAQLQRMPDCAERFRQQRVWGDQPAAPIGDRPEDGIVPRLHQLLRHLVRIDPSGHWDQYLDGTEPNWKRITLTGQSQGGGMAAFVAQTRPLAGVLIFSGGWDRGPHDDIAAWYGRPSQTPPERWYATYHVDEPMASAMVKIYRRLNIPADHISALALPLQGVNPHTEGISNPAYLPIWLRALQQP